MRKGFWKRCLALGSALAVAAGLCACGGKGTEADPAIAKENVYRLQEIELPKLYDPANGNMSLLASRYDREGGKVKLLARIMDWSGQGGSDNDYRLISVNADGSGVRVVNLDIPETNAQGEAGAAAGARTAETMPALPPGGEEDVPLPELPSVWENTYYSNFFLKADGTVQAVKRHDLEDMSDPENYVRTSTSAIVSWDAEGKLISEVSLGEMDDRTWIASVMEGSDDALYLILNVSSEDYSRTDYYRVRVGADGSIGERKKLADESLPLFNNGEQMLPKGDGTCFALFSDEKDWTKKFYASYDVAADKMGEARTFPSSLTYNYNMMVPGSNHDLIYANSSGIYSWDEGGTEGKLMVNYVNSDLYIENIYNVVELSEQSLLAFYQETWESPVKAGIFTYVKPEDIKDKKVMVLAGTSVNYDIKKRVIEYNRNNADYRIVIKEYDEFNTYDDYNVGFNRLNSDIIAGNMPDILINSNYNGSLPVSNYVSKGLLADIDKLIEQDEEFSKVEFMQNAFDAYRVNGKLYSIISDFEVYTMIAKKSLVGDRESWTMADMQQVVEKMGGEAKAFSLDVTRDNFINMVMRYCGNRFVDLSAGKCEFNTQDFISMMEYAKQLPANNDPEKGEIGIDVDIDWEEYWNNYESQYRQNRTLLLEANFWRFDNVAHPINGRMGEDVSYVGFPTDGGNGSYIMSGTSYLLSAKSKHLDEAWNFMRYYLTEEVQDQVSYFPVRKDKFYEKSGEAMKKRTYEWTDENGEIHVEEENMAIWINGEEVPYNPLSREQLDGLIAFIESVRNPYYYNEEIMKIIDEEIEAFFSGQKSAADVADVIQRRARNYVDEG